MTALIREIEHDQARSRDGRPVLGVEKILAQDRFKAPSKDTKSSPRPRFHVESDAVRDALWHEFRIFRLEYGQAARALLSGELAAAWDFPKGSYPPALPFVGKPAPPTPPPPPRREITETESGTIERGEVPVVEIAGRWQAADPPKPQAPEEPRARGQPP
ncbi:MAG: hypothetical protein GY856_33145 [bacterium]|nr:hypothetical protein [bacterium]